MDSSHAAQPTVLQRFLGSRLVTGTGMFLSRYTPPFLGYAVTGLIAGLINRLKPGVYWIVYANLRQVMGAQASERELHRLVRQVFRNNAVHNYELWRLVGRGLEAIRATVYIPPEFWACVRDAQQRGQGVIIAGTHTCNFDLAILALATHEVEVQLLGLAASPAGGFDLMDRMRRNAGVNLTSISASSLRQAIQRLRAGGVVMTGVDRPVGDEMLSPLSGGSWRGVEFFGRPSLLPTGHVRLALKADAAIAVASPIVNWTIMALIEAEEQGITSKNVDDMLKSTDPNIQRFLGVTPGMGKALGLDEKWAYNIIKQVGNYGEIFERNVGPNTPLKLDRGLNALWTKGGLMYAAPFR